MQAQVPCQFCIPRPPDSRRCRNSVSLPTAAARSDLQSTEKEAHVLKVIVLMPRRADMSREDFRQYLRETTCPWPPRCPGCGGWW
jgi:hypothetical protein